MIEEQMNIIIAERKKKHMEDDYGIQECWKKMINILAVDDCQTIEYLENCTWEELYYISEIIEDVSMQLQSKAYIQCLRMLDRKFPELNMKKDIDLAEMYT